MKTTLALLCATVASGSALAQPVTYSLNGVANGSVGNTDFFGNNFEITLTGDFDDVFSDVPGLFRFVTDSATISIDGLLSDAVFTPRISLVSNQNLDVLVLGDFDQDLGLLILNNPEFVDYDLSAPFGAVTDTSPQGFLSSSEISTSEGNISLGQAFSVTYSAVPAPGSAGLMALGGLVAMRHRR